MHMIRALLADHRGAVALEALIVTPPLMLIGIAGLELTNRITTQSRVFEMAQIIADDASRAGNSLVLGQMPLRESDINDVLNGAMLQGQSIDFENNGRVILSSLEQDVSGRQTITWRRCKGKLAAGSDYANISNIPTPDARGILMRGKWVSAPPRGAVMVVELSYNYTPFMPIFPASLPSFGPEVFKAQAVRLVRDNRDLSGIAPDASAARCTS